MSFHGRPETKHPIYFRRFIPPSETCLLQDCHYFFSLIFLFKWQQKINKPSDTYNFFIAHWRNKIFLCLRYSETINIWFRINCGRNKKKWLLLTNKILSPRLPLCLMSPIINYTLFMHTNLERSFKLVLVFPFVGTVIKCPLEVESPMEIG